MAFKNYIQHYIMDCGPTCLKMIAKFHGRSISLDTLREKIKVSKHGVSLFGVKEVAKSLGLETEGLSLSLDQLEETMLPVMAHWQQNHFLIVYKIKKNKVYVSDPAKGNRIYTREEFIRSWSSYNLDGIPQGIVLTFEPTERFYQLTNEREFGNSMGIMHLVSLYAQYKKDIYFVLAAIGLSSGLQFMFPFLTQLIVDRGISTKDIGIVGMVLFAQFSLLVGRLFIEYMRSWMLLYIGSKINVTILSEFLIKLLKLPISFFDTKMSGDILQRLNDQRRIQDFLTGPALDLLFSTVTIMVLSTTLFFYSPKIFLVFLVSTLLYISWSLLLLKSRRVLDYKRFEYSGQNHNAILQLISGIQEVKLNNAETRKRLSWEKIQAKLFGINISSLKVAQTQQSGSFLINEGKNIMITYLAATSVIHGHFTLGVMLAIQAIIGQLNSPISTLINLFQNFYDTKLSIERLNEIHKISEEIQSEKHYKDTFNVSRSILIKGLTFSYPATYGQILKNINLEIPQGKVTAIVGSSGSGKTTLLKLLLKFYEDYGGNIYVGNTNFKDLDHSFWRDNCGTVLQDGFIFSDTIARNISISTDEVDKGRLKKAAITANISEFVESLPLAYETRIGGDGMGLSQGQKQRILIARAAYKNPEYIFLDEATNSLDANNESQITENLSKLFEHKTVIIVAHRLSTVRHADQILVIDKGEIVERGTHESLISQQGFYHTLVYNQLEIERIV